MAYKQSENRKKRLMRTYNQIKSRGKHYSGSGVWIDEGRGFLYKFTASNTPGYARLLRRCGNKKIRQSKEVHNYGEYRRVYDYKWTLF